MALHIRFDHVDGLLKDFMEFMPKLKPERYIVAHEISKQSEKSHYHVYVETDVKAVNARNNLNNNVSKFKALPKAGKYVKAWGDKPEDRWYFCKGTDIRHIRGFTWEDIKEYHKSSEMYVSNLKEETANKAGNITEVLYERCTRSQHSELDQIAGEYVRMYMEWKKPLCIFHARKVVRTVYLLIHGDSKIQNTVYDIISGITA